MFRSNKDRVVGYDEFLQQPGMTFGREGGEQMPNNPGVNALPNSVQRKIVDNMKYGGPKGEDIYLSRKDAAIKASMAQAQDGTEMNYTEGMRQREGSYNPPNRKYTLDPRFRQGGGEVVDLSADMITELIAAGADIEIL